MTLALSRWLENYGGGLDKLRRIPSESVLDMISWETLLKIGEISLYSFLLINPDS